MVLTAACSLQCAHYLQTQCHSIVGQIFCGTVILLQRDALRHLFLRSLTWFEFGKYSSLHLYTQNSSHSQHSNIHWGSLLIILTLNAFKGHIIKIHQVFSHSASTQRVWIHTPFYTLTYCCKDCSIYVQNLKTEHKLWMLIQVKMYYTALCHICNQKDFLKMHKVLFGENNSVFSFLNALCERLVPGEESGQMRLNPKLFVFGMMRCFTVRFHSQTGLQPFPGWSYSQTQIRNTGWLDISEENCLDGLGCKKIPSQMHWEHRRSDVDRTGDQMQNIGLTRNEIYVQWLCIVLCCFIGITSVSSVPLELLYAKMKKYKACCSIMIHFWHIL